MLEPKLTDYVSVIMQLFEQFMQHRIDKQGVKNHIFNLFIHHFLHVDAVSWHLWFHAMAVANHTQKCCQCSVGNRHRTTIARRYQASNKGVCIVYRSVCR